MPYKRRREPAHIWIRLDDARKLLELAKFGASRVVPMLKESTEASLSRVAVRIKFRERRLAREEAETESKS